MCHSVLAQNTISTCLCALAQVALSKFHFETLYAETVMRKSIWSLVQRHSFRAKPICDIASGPSEGFGAAGPSIFGPGAVPAPVDESQHSLSWTSGMARNRFGIHKQTSG